MAGDKRLPVTVVVGAVDNVTYKVMAITEKLKKITSPLGKVKSAFALLGEESGLTSLVAQIGKVGATGKAFLSSVSDTIMKVSAVSIAAGGAIFGLAKTFSNAGDEVALLSKRLGLSTDAFQELAYAANIASVPQEMFTQSMTKFSQGIAEAAIGTGNALVAFNALGLSVRDNVTGKLKTLESMLPEVADKLGAVRNQNLRNALAAKIFGKEGAKLNEIFNEGSQGLAKLRKEARDVGAVMSPEQIKAATDFDQGMKSITATLLMVRNILGAALAPVVVDLGKKLQKFILEHRKDIEKFAAAFSERLPVILADIASKLETIGRAVGPVIRLIGALVERFGEVNVAIAGLAVWLGGGLLSSLARFAWSLVGLVGPAAKVSLVLFHLLAGAVQALAMGLAALVGWPVLVGAAFVAAAVAAYKYWKPFQEFIDGIVGKVKGIFGAGSLQTNVTQSPAGSTGFAPSMGFGKTVDASLRSPATQKLESILKVDFTNIPKGTRVETIKTDSDLDLSMGYLMAGT